MNVENRRLKVYNSFRAELREVAIDIFAKRGFDLVSIRDIAFAAGISERAFSRYYSEKEDILLDGFCEESVGFRKSLMALPRSLLPIDAFEQAILADGQSSIWFEGARAAMLYSPDSRKLRAAFNERGVNWQVKIAEAIAVWLGCSTATDFRPALWASAIYTAILSAIRVIAGKTGTSAELNHPSKVVDVAFQNLRSLVGSANQPPNNLAGTSSVHLVSNA